MNVRYKTFASRTNQDIKFDQILRTKPLANHPSPTNASTFSSPLISKPAYSPRKRVNVVSFTPGADGQELITKSPEKPTVGANDHSSDPVTLFRPKDASDCSGIPNSCDTLVLPMTTSGAQTLVATGTSSSTPCFNVVYTSQSTPITVVGKRSTDICSRQSNPKAQTGFVLQVPETAPGVKPVPLNQRTKCANKTQPPVSATKTVSLVREPIIASKPPFTKPDPQLINSRTIPPSNPSASVGPISSVCKVIPLSRATSFPLQSSRSVNELPAAKVQLSSVPNGKRKRVAYNPRSWQQELDPEEGSPTKQPKLPNPRTNPGPATTSPTTSTVNSLPSNPRSTSVPVRTQPPNKNPVGSKPPEVIHKPVMATNQPRNFDFPDSDGEDSGKLPMTVSRTKLPRLTSLMCGLSHSPPSPASTKEPSPPPNEKDQDEEEENDSGELDDDEIDDVKPWFCPADRRDLQRTTAKPNTQVSCPAGSRVEKSQKPLYTVVRKVNEAHVCQERGETQHLLDDVEYLIDGLADHNQANTRALSVLTLANKCLTASFRYLISAHGLVKRICANLHDAYKDYTLALTAAGLFFILSRDRDPNIFDTESLPVVIKLLQAPDSITRDNAGVGGVQAMARANKEADRVRTRVRQLLEGLQQQRPSSNSVTAENSPASSQSTTPGAPKRPILSSSVSAPASLAPAPLTAGTAGLNTRHLQMTRQLTAADLVLESILNLGTRKAADWFKAELRQGGGLDRVADAASDAVDYLADLDPTESGRNRSKAVWRSSANPTGLDGFALDKLRRVCHYTKLLENMTYMDTDNQTYLVRYRDRLLINHFIRCIRLCASHLPKQSIVPNVGDSAKGSTAKPPTDQLILVDCLLGIFRFLVNVSHNEFASDRLGGCPGLLETILECVLNLPPRLPTNKRFDLLVLTLCLLANLCEHCPENRTRLVHLDIPKPSVDQDGEAGPSDEEEDEENEDDNSRNQTPMVSALDEIVHLFSVREEQARNHDFERDDEDAAAAEARRREQPGWNGSGEVRQLDPLGQPTHVEEAGLKWRLIEDRKAAGMLSTGRLPGERSRKNSRRRLRQKRREERRRALALAKRSTEGSEDEDDEEEDESSDEDGDLDDEYLDDLDDQDDDDDESVGSGADVEFVAETQEEQEKLAEHMSQAQQHMEDSVVAAYVALLIGCIIQSSRLYAEKIRGKLPNGQFRPLAIMLAKLLSFLSLTKGVGSSGSETILRIVRILEAQDKNNPSLNGSA